MLTSIWCPNCRQDRKPENFPNSVLWFLGRGFRVWCLPCWMEQQRSERSRQAIRKQSSGMPAKSPSPPVPPKAAPKQTAVAVKSNVKAAAPTQSAQFHRASGKRCNDCKAHKPLWHFGRKGVGRSDTCLECVDKMVIERHAAKLRKVELENKRRQDEIRASIPRYIQ